MKENQKIARIAYNKEKDEYQLLLSTDRGKEWGFSYGSKCQQRKDDDPDAEPLYVYCGIIEEMKKAILNGFEIVY